MVVSGRHRSGIYGFACFQNLHNSIHLSDDFRAVHPNITGNKYYLANKSAKYEDKVLQAITFL